MRIASFAAKVAVLDVLLGIVPGRAPGSHGNSHKEPRYDTADQQGAEGDLAEQKSNQKWSHHRQQRRHNHLLQGIAGHDIHAGCIIRFAGTFHDTGNFPELPPDLVHDCGTRASYRFHGNGAKEKGQEASNEKADDHVHVAQPEDQLRSLAACGMSGLSQVLNISGKEHQGRQACRTDGIPFGNGLGGIPNRIQGIGDGAHTFIHLRHLSNTARIIGDRAIGINGNHHAGHR